MTDIAALLSVFATRMAGGYAICLALIGLRVTQGSWRSVSLFTIAGLAVVAAVSGAALWAALGTAAAALLVQRAIQFDLKGLGSSIWMLPFGIWIIVANEPVGLATFPSAIAIGGTLGAMLLGHSYLTARGLSFDPLKWMALLLFWVLVVRALFVVPAFFPDTPIDWMDWVFLSMRCAFGLALPLVLGWMVIQCVKVESNQSATGILYVMTVLVGVFGELIAVYLNTRGIAA